MQYATKMRNVLPFFHIMFTQLQLQTAHEVSLRSVNNTTTHSGACLYKQQSAPAQVLWIPLMQENTLIKLDRAPYLWRKYYYI